LDGGSDRRKAATYPQDNTNTEQKQTNIHASSGIRTHDLSAGAGEDSSCLRSRGHCDRLFPTLVLVTQKPGRLCGLVVRVPGYRT
jgi:hypothetical protein